MKTRVLFLWCWCVLIFARAAEPEHPLVAHEWGTFTNVQGADGVQMEWNLLKASELPGFVHTPYGSVTAVKLGNLRVTGKLGTMQRQRMETPVIYFYGDPVPNLDVAVRFPEGTITEWYPRATVAKPGTMDATARLNEPAIHWKDLQVVPEVEAAQIALPQETSGSHYYAARNTDSAVLRATETGEKTEAEKFLFYRGMASFTTPLQVGLASDDGSRVVLTNTGKEELQDLFLYSVAPQSGSAPLPKTVNGHWLHVDRLKAGESQEVALSTGANTNFSALKIGLQAALVRQGLYEREAAAMIQTWESSWFEDKGLRVLYLLPRPWTDRNLPLQITPTPARTARVMVARSEILTPRMLQTLLDVVDRYVAADPSARAPLVEEARALGMGRFMDPALRLLTMKTQHSAKFYSLSWELLQAAAAPPVTVSEL